MSERERERIMNSIRSSQNFSVLGVFIPQETRMTVLCMSTVVADPHSTDIIVNIYISLVFRFADNLAGLVTVGRKSQQQHDDYLSCQRGHYTSVEKFIDGGSILMANKTIKKN